MVDTLAQAHTADDKGTQAAQRANPGPAVVTPPRSLLKMQSLRPLLDFRSDPASNKVPGDSSLRSALRRVPQRTVILCSVWVYWTMQLTSRSTAGRNLFVSST